MDDWERQYGEVLMPTIVEAHGKRLVGVGNRLLELTPEHDFYTLIWDYALDFLGDSFVSSNRKQNASSKHEIIKWLEAYESTETKQSGAGASWIRFAYDVYTVGSNAGFAERIKEKLKDKQGFQGARFELWVAALVVAAGFEIEYVDESASGGQHPEFIATHKLTKQRIAIEAKSRHRGGVKGFKGDFSNNATAKDIESITRKGLKKTGLPLILFVDTNLPKSLEYDFEAWCRDVTNVANGLGIDSSDKEFRANLVYFFNDPSHYHLEENVTELGAHLWQLHISAENPMFAVKRMGQISKDLQACMEKRLHVPITFPELP